ncbi:hypothetical protein QJS04_geneDACA007656 [Acorus gramineus]|uniref:HMA domain-containing protein n=1 Tax=Acorus gramineus TaxID=55184 RepID=A0AAV9B640_ACOGR|nr:hypothetical protein QJS04_geneDACA007656 [Acorus gramineus]
MSQAKNPSDKAVKLELKVYMHCKHCERSVFNVLRKFKGVETVLTDMKSDTAIATGKFDTNKLLKKLKKKTGKRVEIVSNIDPDEEVKAAATELALKNCTNLENRISMSGCLDEKWVFGLDVFSDENPNACYIM